jgi:acetamidase/formamidase
MDIRNVLEPDARTLHGYFSRGLPPVLEIDPGDTVVFQTLDAGWGLEPHRPGPTSRGESSSAARRTATRSSGPSRCAAHAPG